jgi:hypothetical protein
MRRGNLVIVGHYAVPRAVPSKTAGKPSRAAWLVDLFDPRLDAGSYLTKPPAGPADPGDAYESAKFGSSTCSLMIAQAAWKFAASRRAAQLMR